MSWIGWALLSAAFAAATALLAKVGVAQLQIGQPPAGPTVDYRPSPGEAQGLQIRGGHPGSEVIGTVLLTPNQASDRELGKIETCLAEGVKG